MKNLDWVPNVLGDIEEFLSRNDLNRTRDMVRQTILAFKDERALLHPKSSKPEGFGKRPDRLC